MRNAVVKVIIVFLVDKGVFADFVWVEILGVCFFVEVDCLFDVGKIGYILGKELYGYFFVF